MRNSLIISLTFLSTLIFASAYAQNNLSAVDVLDEKQKEVSQPDKPVPQERASDDKPLTQEKQIPVSSEEDMEKIRAYHELFNNRQKELELIKLELEKSSLLLKKKEAEKELYQIEKMLPQGKKEDFRILSDVKEPLVDVSDIKIQFCLSARFKRKPNQPKRNSVFF
jgi:hypothetical protein